MTDVVVDGRVIIVDDNRLFENGHHLSLLREDIIDFFGSTAPQIYLSGAAELALCLWKASAVRSTPMEGGRLVAANILRNLTALATLGASHRPTTSTIHSDADTKFMTVFCSTHYCSVFGLSHEEHVVFRLCPRVPSIDRVVLRAHTVEAFRLASEESFKTELRDIMTKRMLLCMEDCNFGICISPFSSYNQTQFWQQLYVVSCIPSCQGCLTETSEIVVKCHSETNDMLLSCPKKHSCCSGHSDAAVEAVMVSDFAVDIANNCSWLMSQKLDICLSKLKESVQAWVLNFTILMDIERVKSFITLQQSEDVSDEFSVAVFSRDCASRLGIMNGNMLELSCKSHEQQQWSASTRLSETHQHSCRRKVVIAYIDTVHIDDDMMACISSCAWFNLCSISCVSLSGSCSIQPCYVKVCLLRVF